MGYLTTFSLNKISGPDKDYDSLVKDIHDEYGVELQFGDQAKWYECIDDMCRLTGKYPDLTVQLNGEGESGTDIWAARFRNGQCESCSCMTTPKFFKLSTRDERRESLRQLMVETRRNLLRFLDSYADGTYTLNDGETLYLGKDEDGNLTGVMSSEGEKFSVNLDFNKVRLTDIADIVEQLIEL